MSVRTSSSDDATDRPSAGSAGAEPSSRVEVPAGPSAPLPADALLPVGAPSCSDSASRPPTTPSVAWESLSSAFSLTGVRRCHVTRSTPSRACALACLGRSWKMLECTSPLRITAPPCSPPLTIPHDPSSSRGVSSGRSSSRRTRRTGLRAAACKEADRRKGCPQGTLTVPSDCAPFGAAGSRTWECCGARRQWVSWKGTSILTSTEAVAARASPPPAAALTVAATLTMPTCRAGILKVMVSGRPFSTVGSASGPFTFISAPKGAPSPTDDRTPGGTRSDSSAGHSESSGPLDCTSKRSVAPDSAAPSVLTVTSSGKSSPTKHAGGALTLSTGTAVTRPSRIL
mmetsp:Transcript_4971/g.9060  ORF Transcript_4971/g.9060 Transcript_4971/m.9060 type:complete len:343 (-) Transcript_4971:230-1258(-)